MPKYNQEIRPGVDTVEVPNLTNTIRRLHEPVPGPAHESVNVQFKIVPVQNNNFPVYEAIRTETQKQTGHETALIIYDVSPNGSSQELADQLKKFSDIIVFDHHGGAAPEVEVRGKEVTAAEVTVSGLPELWKSKALETKDGQPMTIVAATHSMNVDPDAVITGFLIESFMNPDLRDIVWNEPTLDLLVKAARCGDISLFGGIDIPNLQPDNMSDEMKIAFSILHLINFHKEQLVINTKLEEIATLININKVSQEWFENPKNQFGSVEEAKKELEDEICSKVRSMQRHNHGLKEIRDEVILELLGDDFVTVADIKNLEPNELHDVAFRVLSRTQVREVFVGKPNSDIYSLQHEPFWNEDSINLLLSNVREKLPALLDNIDQHEKWYWSFGKGLKEVHELAAECSTVTDPLQAPHKQITVSKPNGRLDHHDGIPQGKQPFPVYDWLREASAAYGDPMLHVMNRGGLLTIAARAPQPGEKAPFVNLNHPEFVSDLIKLENSQAEIKGAVPVRFLIKANVVLPMGSHSVTFSDVIALLMVHYDSIVTPYSSSLYDEPVFHSVDYGNGVSGPFDGSYHFLQARGLLTNK